MSKLQDGKFPQGNIPTGVCLSRLPDRKKASESGCKFLPAKKFQTLRNVSAWRKNSSVPPLFSSSVCRVLAHNTPWRPEFHYSFRWERCPANFERPDRELYYVLALCRWTLERRLAIVLIVSATGRNEVSLFKSLLVAVTIELHWIMSFLSSFRQRISRC